MENKALKEIADEIMLKKGNLRGDAIKSHEKFIRYKEGESGLARVSEKMKEIGYPVNFNKIKVYDWYPASLALLVIITAKEIFNWDDSVIEESGSFTIKNSLVVRVSLKYFVSLEKLFQLFNQFWDKNYDFGKIEIAELNRKDKFFRLQVKEYDLHPINCIAFRAIGREMVGYVTRKKVTIEETKCIHKGDDCHEYLVKWSE
jgi:hypothetical protein